MATGWIAGWRPQDCLVKKRLAIEELHCIKREGGNTKEVEQMVKSK